MEPEILNVNRCVMDYHIFVTLKIIFYILLIKCVDGNRCVILGYPEQIIFDFNLSATVIF